MPRRSAINYEDLHLLVDDVDRSGFPFLWNGIRPGWSSRRSSRGHRSGRRAAQPLPHFLRHPPLAPAVITFTGGLTTDLAFFRPSRRNLAYSPRSGFALHGSMGNSG